MAFSNPAPSGYQNQHVIPIQFMNNPALVALRNAGLFERDGEANRLALPTKSTATEAVRTAIATDIPSAVDAVHQGPHKAYSEYVDKILTEIASDAEILEPDGSLKDSPPTQQAVGRGSPRRLRRPNNPRVLRCDQRSRPTRLIH